VALVGDYNVVPTNADIYSPRTWLGNALLQPEPRAAYARLLKQGWMDALREIPEGGGVHVLGLPQKPVAAQTPDCG